MSLTADVIGLGILLRWQDKATAEIKKTQNAVESLSGSLDDASKKSVKLQNNFLSLAKAGAGITAFGVAGAIGLYAVSKAAGAFQESLSGALAISAAGSKDLRALEDDLTALSLSLSSELGYSASEINKTFYQVIMAGAKAGTKEFKLFSETALKLAKVTGVEAPQAVGYLENALGSFGLKADSVSRMADVLFKTTVLGGTDIDRLADSFKEASKVAMELGIPLEDTASIIAGLAQRGVKGREAGLVFRTAISRLASPAGEAREALAKLGVEVYDVNTRKLKPMLDILKSLQTGLSFVSYEERELALRAIAGEEAFTKLGALLALDVDTLKTWSKELAISGSLQTAFTQKTRTLSFAADLFKQSLANLAVVIGSHLLPIITPLLLKLSGWLSTIREFLSAHPVLAKTAVIFGAIAVAAALVIGPVVTLAGLIGAMGGIPAILTMVSAGFVSLGAATAGFGAMLASAFWPITAIVAGVALLYLAFKNNFLGINNIVAGVGKILWSFISGIAQGISAAFTPIVQTFNETWSALKQTFAPLADLLTELFAMLGLSNKTQSFFTTLSQGAQVLGRVLGFGLVLPIKLVLGTVIGLIKGFAWLIKTGQAMTNWLVDTFSSGWQTASVAMLGAFSPLSLIVVHWDKVKQVGQNVLAWFKTAWPLLKDVLLLPFKGLLSGWEAIKTTLLGSFNLVSVKLAGAFIAVKDAIVSVLNWLCEKISWLISQIPDALLPPGLAGFKSNGNNRPLPMAGQMLVSAVSSANQRAMPAPIFPRESFVYPAPAFNGSQAAGQSVINIQPGAIVIYANKIDEAAAQKIDRELAKLLERRRSRQ